MNRLSYCPSVVFCFHRIIRKIGDEKRCYGALIEGVTKAWEDSRLGVGWNDTVIVWYGGLAVTFQ